MTTIKIGTEVGIKPASGHETSGTVVKIRRDLGFGDGYDLDSCDWDDDNTYVTVKTVDQGYAGREASRLWKV